MPENRAAAHNEHTVLAQYGTNDIKKQIDVKFIFIFIISKLVTLISSETFVLNSEKSSSSVRQPI